MRLATGFLIKLMALVMIMGSACSGDETGRSLGRENLALTRSDRSVDQSLAQIDQELDELDRAQVGVDPGRNARRNCKRDRAIHRNAVNILAEIEIQAADDPARMRRDGYLKRVRRTAETVGKELGPRIAVSGFTDERTIMQVMLDLINQSYIDYLAFFETGDLAFLDRVLFEHSPVFKELALELRNISCTESTTTDPE